MRVEQVGRAEKLLGLEVLRFVSAVAVLFWHYQNFWNTPHGLVGFERDQQPLYRYFSAFYEFGRYGVQVFWSISGYIFFWKYRDAIAKRLTSGRKFFFLRFSRLYPLHFATLLLVAALQGLYFNQTGDIFGKGQDDLYHFVLQVLMASNWGFQVGSSFNVPIWSISIEILIYILFFIVLRYLGSSLLWSIGIVVAGAIGYFLSHTNPIFQCVVCFYVGGLMACFAITPFAHKHRVLLGRMAMGTLVSLPLLGEYLHLFELKPVVQTFSIGYVALVLYFMAEHLKIPGVLYRFIAAAGNMTYSSYLIHFPMQLSVAIVCTYVGRAIPKESVVFFLFYFALVLLLAVLIYRYFEMPCQRLIRSRFVSAR
jgi:peptidoglycan/LPS O-acetylase OafA/YrhL